MQTGSKPPVDAQQTIEQFRALFADAPELGKKALESVIAELKSQVTEPREKVGSAGLAHSTSRGGHRIARLGLHERRP